MNNKVLTETWAEFLSQYPWQWFCTFTFRTSPHPEAAFKTFRHWVNLQDRKLYNSRAVSKGHGIHWCLALEYHKSGVIHFHALCGDTQNLNDTLSRIDATGNWHDLAGYALIDPIDEQLLAVTNYVSKYVAKGGEIELSDSLNEFAVQYSGLRT